MFGWLRLVTLNDHDLSRTGIALINAICAQGLPGAASADLEECARKVDELAERVRYATHNLKPQFDRAPKDFYNSNAYFRALCMITILQRDCGIAYNPAKIPDDVPFTPADSFLFGLIGTNLGTCANMPVLYAAVGRRLGYPIKLVSAKGNGATHLFVRWEGRTGEWFNMESTAQGLRCPPNDYYRTGRYETSADLERKGQFLQSMTPREELASFLAERSLHWQDIGNFRRAAEAMAWACSLAPRNAFYCHGSKIVFLPRRTPPLPPFFHFSMLFTKRPIYASNSRPVVKLRNFQERRSGRS